MDDQIEAVRTHPDRLQFYVPVSRHVPLAEKALRVALKGVKEASVRVEGQQIIVSGPKPFNGEGQHNLLVAVRTNISKNITLSALEESQTDSSKERLDDVLKSAQPLQDIYLGRSATHPMQREPTSSPTPFSTNGQPKNPSYTNTEITPSQPISRIVGRLPPASIEQLAAIGFDIQTYDGLQELRAQMATEEDFFSQNYLRTHPVSLEGLQKAEDNATDIETILRALESLNGKSAIVEEQKEAYYTSLRKERGNIATILEVMRENIEGYRRIARVIITSIPDAPQEQKETQIEVVVTESDPSHDRTEEGVTHQVPIRATPTVKQRRRELLELLSEHAAPDGFKKIDIENIVGDRYRGYKALITDLQTLRAEGHLRMEGKNSGAQWYVVGQNDSNIAVQEDSKPEQKNPERKVKLSAANRRRTLLERLRAGGKLMTPMALYRENPDLYGGLNLTNVYWDVAELQKTDAVEMIKEGRSTFYGIKNQTIENRIEEGTPLIQEPININPISPTSVQEPPSPQQQRRTTIIQRLTEHRQASGWNKDELSLLIQDLYAGKPATVMVNDLISLRSDGALVVETVEGKAHWYLADSNTSNSIPHKENTPIMADLDLRVRSATPASSERRTILLQRVLEQGLDARMSRGNIFALVQDQYQTVQLLKDDLNIMREQGIFQLTEPNKQGLWYVSIPGIRHLHELNVQAKKEEVKEKTASETKNDRRLTLLERIREIYEPEGIGVSKIEEVTGDLYTNRKTRYADLSILRQRGLLFMRGEYKTARWFLQEDISGLAESDEIPSSSEEVDRRSERNRHVEKRRETLLQLLAQTEGITKKEMRQRIPEYQSLSAVTLYQDLAILRSEGRIKNEGDVQHSKWMFVQYEKEELPTEPPSDLRDPTERRETLLEVLRTQDPAKGLSKKEIMELAGIPREASYKNATRNDLAVLLQQGHLRMEGMKATAKWYVIPTQEPLPDLA